MKVVFVVITSFKGVLEDVDMLGYSFWDGGGLHKKDKEYIVLSLPMVWENWVA